MIPGFLIGWLTFPGVIVHELAHALFCRWFKVPIYEIKFFQFHASFRQPLGYVIHGRTENSFQNVMIGIGPFLVNTIVGAVIGMPAALPILKFGGGDPVDYFLIWLGVSIAMHAFPSTGDAASIWKAVTDDRTSPVAKVLAAPIVGMIYLGALGSMFWLDFIYGVAVVAFLPNLIVQALA